LLAEIDQTDAINAVSAWKDSPVVVDRHHNFPEIRGF
jgi:hypothetical protein